MLRSVAAGFAGMLIASLLVFAVEFGNSLMFPFPPGFNMNDPVAIAAFIKTMPPVAFLVVWIGWVVGAFTGTYVAKKLTPGASKGPAMAVAVLFTLFCVFNMTMLPHPLLFVIGSIVATPLASLAAFKLPSPSLA